MSSCHSCKAETKYVCLVCQAPVCNRPECAVFLPEETPNWKSGQCVSACLSCNTNSELKANRDSEPQDAATTIPLVQASNAQSGAKTRKRPPQTETSKETAKRNCLSLQQRVEMINYAKNHPNEGYRKVTEKFRIGRMQAQKILKEREEILARYENNQVQLSKKRVRSAKYSDVNETLWKWYTLCRESNIPVDGTMLQEEALLIAEKLGISGFTASNGWLQRFKQHYNLQRMATAGQDGDVSNETLERWSEREGNYTRMAPQRCMKHGRNQ